MDHVKIILATVFLASLMFAGAGCWTIAAAGAAAGGVAYAKGDLEAVVEGSPHEVVDASRRALEEMDIAVVSSQSSDVDGEVIGRTATDTKVTIKIKQISASDSKLSIRVGVFGDEALSRAIFQHVQENL